MILYVSSRIHSRLRFFETQTWVIRHQRQSGGWEYYETVMMR